MCTATDFLPKEVIMCSKYIYTVKTTTQGLFVCISYHRKHLDLISSKTLSTCYFSAGWSLLWGMKDKHPNSYTTCVWRMVQLWPPCDKGHRAAWASFSSCQFCVRLSRTIHAFNVCCVSSASQNLIWNNMTFQFFPTMEIVLVMNDEKKNNPTTQLKLKLPSDLNAASEICNIYMHV